MSENILSPDPAPTRGDSSTGDLAESQVGTPKAGGVSPVVLPQPKKSPVLLFIALTLLAAVSVFAIYLFLQVRTLTLEKITPSPTPTPVASADPTEGWQTYQNTNYGLLMKYPTGWELSESPIPDNDKWFGRNLAQLISPKASISHGEINGGYYITLTVNKPNPNYSTFQEYIDYSTDQYKYLYSNTIINNINGYIFTENGKKAGYIFEKDGLFFVINWITDQDNLLLDQILSTIKFTDPTVDSEYVCPPNGWQDCMPILSEEGQKACSEEAMQWYQSNCPDFQGAAL